MDKNVSSIAICNSLSMQDTLQLECVTLNTGLHKSVSGTSHKDQTLLTQNCLICTRWTGLLIISAVHICVAHSVENRDFNTLIFHQHHGSRSSPLQAWQKEDGDSSDYQQPPYWANSNKERCRELERDISSKRWVKHYVQTSSWGSLL